MNLTNKPALMSASYKGHNVKPLTEGGDEGGDAGTPVPAREYRFTNILLTQKQFEKLVGEHAFRSFFNVGKKPAEPAFSTFDTIRLKDTYKDCAAKIVFGVANNDFEIEGGAKVKNLSVKIEQAGVASLSCTLVAVFPRNLKTLDLENFLGKEVTLSLRLGKIDEGDESPQGKLPIDGADSEMDEDDADESEEKTKKAA